MHFGIAATTVSLMVGELSRKGILEWLGDDRRHRIVSITRSNGRLSTYGWLAAQPPGPAHSRQSPPLNGERLVETLVACGSD